MISAELLLHSYPYLLKGALVTIEIATVSMVIGTVFGCLIGGANCRRVRIPFLSTFLKGYVWAIRGTPLFVQLLFVFYALPEFLGVSFSPFSSGVIALGLNSAAYVSELVRAGIDNIPDGQWDASYVLGLNRWQTMRGVIFPQILNVLLPGLTNELTSLIKETSILMAIGTAELTKVSRDIVVRELDPVTIYLGTAILYLCMTTALSSVTAFLQRRAFA